MTRNLCIPVKNALWAFIPYEGKLFLFMKRKVLFRYVWLQLCINLTLDPLKTERIA